LKNKLGIDLYFGRGTFTGSNSIEVNGKKIEFLKACIATGAKPRIPKIIGLEDVPYYTTESVFNLTVKPKKMAIIGSGPAAAELGQAF